MPFALAIHGGAGTIEKKDLTPALEQQYLQALEDTLLIGKKMLQAGASATEVVAAAVVNLEDFPLFNAGKGSVFGNNGKHEMDASIMRGSDKQAGACAGVIGVRNPILLAKAIMEHNQHLLLVGKGAEQFAQQINLPFESEDYFYTEQRYKQWQSVKDSDTASLDHNIKITDKKFGTVGAVACDANGSIAAATSTGGLTNKKWGRVGDTPIIGSGTWADDKTCAISCTGNGEDFIRAVAAYDVACLMEYKGLTLEQAMQTVVMDKLLVAGGEGGMIGVDTKGNISLVFNSTGMYRGFWRANEKLSVAIYQ